MTIWIVFTGMDFEYCDVVGVFSTREKAIQLIEKLKLQIYYGDQNNWQEKDGEFRPYINDKEASSQYLRLTEYEVN